MQYSNYFKVQIRENGLPQLNQYQFLRYLNIIAMENRIFMLDKPEQARQKFRLEMKLTDLTGNLKPEKLYLEMINGSK